MKKKSIDISLIWKKAHGQLSAKKEAQFEAWLAESKKHKGYFRKAVQFYSGEQEDEIPSLNAAWEKINSQIDKPKSPKRKSKHWIYWMAASIIFMMGFAWIWTSFVDSHAPESIAAEISPGTNKATLITGNGRSISIADSPLVLKEGGTVVNSDGQTLAYEKVQNEKAQSNSEAYAENMLIVPTGGKFNLILPDGTKVYLNSETTLVYPVEFSETRSVSLRGEAYFEVVKDVKPFIVSTSGLDIEVLGTCFNIASYPDTDNIAATLVEGKVNVKTANKSIFLIPGEQAVFNKKSKQLIKSEVDTELFTGWVKGLFIFDDQSLAQLIKTLSRWYDMDYFFIDSDKKPLKFTGEIERYEDIENILRLIEKTHAVRFEMKGRTVIIE